MGADEHGGKGYEQLPSSTRAFDLDAPLASAEALVLELCADARGVCARDGTLTMAPVLGGLTNKLFKVEFKGQSVLLRVYGDGGIIDRVAETKQFVALAEAGIGPSCFGRFDNGRLEEFFEGFRTLTAPDLSDRERSQKIAVQLALSHGVIPVQPGEAPSLWKQLDEWLVGAKRASFAENSSEAAEYAAIDLASIEAHLERLVPEVKPNFHVVFCHNDLLAANILEHPVSGEIKLIDFEYGSANYLAFDIANHFNEWAGGTDDGVPNYEWLPTREQMEIFCAAYLREGGNRLGHCRVADLLQQVEVFLVIDHYYWGLWAVNMAASTGCMSFPYLSYCRRRLEQVKQLGEGVDRAGAQDL